MFYAHLLNFFGVGSKRDPLGNPNLQASLEQQIANLCDKPWGRLGLESLRKKLADQVLSTFRYRLDHAVQRGIAVFPVCRLDIDGLLFESSTRPNSQNSLLTLPTKCINSSAYRKIVRAIEEQVRGKLGKSPKLYVKELSEHLEEANRFVDYYILEIDIGNLI